MLNYIRADLRRILRRVPRLIVLVLTYVIINAVTIHDAVSKSQNSIGFMANISVAFMVCSIILGAVEIIAVFADDFRAKTMQVAIGLGITRPCVVLVKAIEYALLALADNLVLSLLLYLGSMSVGIGLGAEDVYLLVIHAICTAANMLIPALLTMILIFWLQGTGLAAIVYILILLDPVAQIINSFFSLNEWVLRLHLNELTFTSLIGTVTTQLTLHTGFPLGQILGLVVYAAAGYLLTVLVFRKRELEF